MSNASLGRTANGRLGPGRNQRLVVPLGATEQHGPHLPFDTDTLIASAWAERVVDRLADAVLAPALPYGSSGEHQDFPGTLSIGQEALELVLIELGRSARASFGSLILLSGHAGNLAPVSGAAALLRQEGDDVRVFFPTWPNAAVPIDAHAGRTETSLLLHLRPESVDLDAAAAGNTAPIGDLLPELRARGVGAVSANGVLGDPAGASAVEGRTLLDDLVDRTVASISAP